MKMYTKQDAKPKALEGRTIGIVGYGAQGRAQALNLRDSGLDVTVALRKGGATWKQATEDGFKPVGFEEIGTCDIIHMLLPDDVQPSVYNEHIAKHLKKGKTLSFSHGFNVHFDIIKPPADVDVWLVAPKAPGTEVRKTYKDNFGTPGLMAIHRDASGHAQDDALAFAHALGLTRAGVIECTFEAETVEDLFGEQAVLCGGVSELIKAGFETLTEAGYPPEMAYFECLHELKLIVDLMERGGLTEMWHVVSNMAEYGGRVIGPRIVTDETRAEMRKVLKEIQDGSFAKRAVAEFAGGSKSLAKMRAQEAEHPIEGVANKVRALFTR
jgi:ketol-acid reductoisomerase